MIRRLLAIKDRGWPITRLLDANAHGDVAVRTGVRATHSFRNGSRSGTPQRRTNRKSWVFNFNLFGVFCLDFLKCFFCFFSMCCWLLFFVVVLGCVFSGGCYCFRFGIVK